MQVPHEDGPPVEAAVRPEPPLIEASEEAIQFIGIGIGIEPSELQKCLFSDSLVTVSEGGSELGEFSVAVDLATRGQRPCLHLRASDSYNLSAVRGLLSEDASLLLMRVMALRRTVPENMTLPSLDPGPLLTRVTYRSLVVKQLAVGPETVVVFGVERAVEEVPALWHCYFLADGHLASREQLGSPVTMRLVQLPPQLEKDAKNDKPPCVKRPLVWEEDMEMRSKFLDRKRVSPVASLPCTSLEPEMRPHSDPSSSSQSLSSDADADANEEPVFLDNQDEKSLRCVFGKLGFQVEVRSDLTAGGIRSVLEDLGKRSFVAADVLVVCVLSHGDKECVFGTDGLKVALGDMRRPFTSERAPTLEGKPKLFFIQACQGSNLQRGAVPCPPRPQEQGPSRGSLEEDVGPLTAELVAEDADFLMGMATVLQVVPEHVHGVHLHPGAVQAAVGVCQEVEKVNCVIETGITKNGQRRVIHSLLSGTGQEITEPSQIRRRAVSFYSTLYASEYEEGETLSEGFWNGLPQVSEEANSQLEGPLTIQELQTALQGMQGRRAPGIDGLSVEFYKAYWDVLSNDLLDVFNESLASGSMPVSCRRAVITLLPKKGNLQDIKNWRPVSLLCVDYKILSKALATRLGKAVEQVIHRDQTYCVPGRSMVDNVHLIRDVLEVSSSLGINTGLISLDQEKAFDRVEHSFLWKVMEKFGFSAGFIAKIKVLYNKIESVLKFNGGLCAPFRVCRGVRQGCALSGMLYALSLEPLLSKIRSKLQGLFLPGLNGNMVLSVYADDVVVFVRDQKDTDILVDIVRDFSSASAARVNWKKSEALAVGEWSGGLPVLPQSMVWKKDGFKYLGVFLGKEIVVLKNWEDQLVDAVGPELSDAQALGSLLGLHSVRVAQRILQLWSQILCPEEKRLLRSYGQGRARPDPADPFPEIYLSPGLGELTGPLLQLTRKHGIKITAGFACTVEEIVEKVKCVIETGITVSEEANSQLEGPLTIQELQTALQGMQGRRAPGIDGLSVEFYRAYWDVLSNDLLDVFNESLASGSMPVSCRRAVITLLPKKGNLQDIKNWRPVSLLCVDYKLLSKALATRLGRAVEQRDDYPTLSGRCSPRHRQRQNSSSPGPPGRCVCDLRSRRCAPPPESPASHTAQGL
ncbi:hypothetical protein NHX12_004318 [Muraenolepis orangiensis]|uniref:Reverse transcriptase domain-containing protein n=1 Tax=Muraenolepis orangiensis TaxID=630683 RepID=A0A9Q0DV91_9TELE|nr:hypothetical protein NHX12_004318 [Muraenolepis orangiensis]